jgi:hypothetical protein
LFSEKAQCRKLPWGKSNQNISYRAAVVARMQSRALYNLFKRGWNEDEPLLPASDNSLFGMGSCMLRGIKTITRDISEIMVIVVSELILQSSGM